MVIKPACIGLDASTICQLRCRCCSNSGGYIKQCLGSGFLKFEDFKRLINDNPWVRAIELSNWGEIFLNPDLLNIIKYAHEKKVLLNAFNGVNLNTVSHEMPEALVKYGFDSISCSIDGASQETYSI